MGSSLPVLFSDAGASLAVRLFDRQGRPVEGALFRCFSVWVPYSLSDVYLNLLVRSRACGEWFVLFALDSLSLSLSLRCMVRIRLCSTKI